MDSLRVSEEEVDITFDGVAYWQGKLFTGAVYYLYQNGGISDENTYRNGLKDGLQRSWYYKSGQIESETNFHNGYEHGLDCEWFEIGHLHIQALWEYGILVRKKEWDEDGTLVRDYEITERDIGYKHLIKRRELASQGRF